MKVKKPYPSETDSELWNLDIICTKKYTRTMTRRKAKELFRAFKRAPRSERKSESFIRGARMKLAVLRLYNNSVLLKKERYPRTKWMFHLLCQYVALEFEGLAPNADPNNCEAKFVVSMLENFLSNYFDVDSEKRSKAFIVFIIVSAYHTYKFPKWYMEALIGLVLKGTAIQKELEVVYSEDDDLIYVGNIWSNDHLKYFMEMDDFATDDEDSDISDQDESNDLSKSMHGKSRRKLEKLSTKNRFKLPLVGENKDDDDDVIIIKDEKDTSDCDSTRDFNCNSPVCDDSSKQSETKGNDNQGSGSTEKRVNSWGNKYKSTLSSNIIIIEDDDEDNVLNKGDIKGEQVDSDVEVVYCDKLLSQVRSGRMKNRIRKKLKTKLSRSVNSPDVKKSPKPICVDDDENEFLSSNHSSSNFINSKTNNASVLQTFDLINSTKFTINGKNPVITMGLPQATSGDQASIDTKEPIVETSNKGKTCFGIDENDDFLKELHELTFQIKNKTENILTKQVSEPICYPPGEVSSIQNISENVNVVSRETIEKNIEDQIQSEDTQIKKSSVKMKDYTEHERKKIEEINDSGITPVMEIESSLTVDLVNVLDISRGVNSTCSKTIAKNKEVQAQSVGHNIEMEASNNCIVHIGKKIQSEVQEIKDLAAIPVVETGSSLILPSVLAVSKDDNNISTKIVGKKMEIKNDCIDIEGKKIQSSEVELQDSTMEIKSPLLVDSVNISTKDCFEDNEKKVQSNVEKIRVPVSESYNLLTTDSVHVLSDSKCRNITSTETIVKISPEIQDQLTESQIGKFVNEMKKEIKDYVQCVGKEIQYSEVEAIKDSPAVLVKDIGSSLTADLVNISTSNDENNISTDTIVTNIDFQVQPVDVGQSNIEMDVINDCIKHKSLKEVKKIDGPDAIPVTKGGGLFTLDSVLAVSKGELNISKETIVKAPEVQVQPLESQIGKTDIGYQVIKDSIEYREKKIQSSEVEGIKDLPAVAITEIEGSLTKNSINISTTPRDENISTETEVNINNLFEECITDKTIHSRNETSISLQQNEKCVENLETSFNKSEECFLKMQNVDNESPKIPFKVKAEYLKRETIVDKPKKSQTPQTLTFHEDNTLKSIIVQDCQEFQAIERVENLETKFNKSEECFLQMQDEADNESLKTPFKVNTEGYVKEEAIVGPLNKTQTPQTSPQEDNTPKSIIVQECQELQTGVQNLETSSNKSEESLAKMQDEADNALTSQEDNTSKSLIIQDCRELQTTERVQQKRVKDSTLRGCDSFQSTVYSKSSIRLTRHKTLGKYSGLIDKSINLPKQKEIHPSKINNSKENLQEINSSEKDHKEMSHNLEYNSLEESQKTIVVQSTEIENFKEQKETTKILDTIIEECKDGVDKSLNKFNEELKNGSQNSVDKSTSKSKFRVDTADFENKKKQVQFDKTFLRSEGENSLENEKIKEESQNEMLDMNLSSNKNNPDGSKNVICSESKTEKDNLYIDKSYTLQVEESEKIEINREDKQLKVGVAKIENEKALTTNCKKYVDNDIKITNNISRTDETSDNDQEAYLPSITIVSESTSKHVNKSMNMSNDCKTIKTDIIKDSVLKSTSIINDLTITLSLENDNQLIGSNIGIEDNGIDQKSKNAEISFNKTRLLKNLEEIQHEPNKSLQDVIPTIIQEETIKERSPLPTILHEGHIGESEMLENTRQQKVDADTDSPQYEDMGVYSSHKDSQKPSNVSTSLLVHKFNEEEKIAHMSKYESIASLPIESDAKSQLIISEVTTSNIALVENEKNMPLKNKEFEEGILLNDIIHTEVMDNELKSIDAITEESSIIEQTLVDASESLQGEGALKDECNKKVQEQLGIKETLKSHTQVQREHSWNENKQEIIAESKNPSERECISSNENIVTHQLENLVFTDDQTKSRLKLDMNKSINIQSIFLKQPIDAIYNETEDKKLISKDLLAEELKAMKQVNVDAISKSQLQIKHVLSEECNVKEIQVQVEEEVTLKPSVCENYENSIIDNNYEIRAESQELSEEKCILANENIISHQLEGLVFTGDVEKSEYPKLEINKNQPIHNDDNDITSKNPLEDNPNSAGNDLKTNIMTDFVLINKETTNDSVVDGLLVTPSFCDNKGLIESNFKIEGNCIPDDSSDLPITNLIENELLENVKKVHSVQNILVADLSCGLHEEIIENISSTPTSSNKDQFEQTEMLDKSISRKLELDISCNIASSDHEDENMQLEIVPILLHEEVISTPLYEEKEIAHIFPHENVISETEMHIKSDTPVNGDVEIPVKNTEIINYTSLIPEDAHISLEKTLVNDQTSECSRNEVNIVSCDAPNSKENAMVPVGSDFVVNGDVEISVRITENIDYKDADAHVTMENWELLQCNMRVLCDAAEKKIQESQSPFKLNSMKHKESEVEVKNGRKKRNKNISKSTLGHKPLTRSSSKSENKNNRGKEDPDVEQNENLKPLHSLESNLKKKSVSTGKNIGGRQVKHAKMDVDSKRVSIAQNNVGIKQLSKNKIGKNGGPKTNKKKMSLGKLREKNTVGKKKEKLDLINKNLKVFNSNDDSSDSFEGKLFIPDEPTSIDCTIIPKKKAPEVQKEVIPTKMMCDMDIQPEPVPSLAEAVTQSSVCQDVSKLLDDDKKQANYNISYFLSNMKPIEATQEKVYIRTKAQMKAFPEGNQIEDNFQCMSRSLTITTENLDINSLPYSVNNLLKENAKVEEPKWKMDVEAKTVRKEHFYVNLDKKNAANIEYENVEKNKNNLELSHCIGQNEDHSQELTKVKDSTNLLAQNNYEDFINLPSEINPETNKESNQDVINHSNDVIFEHLSEKVEVTSYETNSILATSKEEETTEKFKPKRISNNGPSSAIDCVSELLNQTAECIESSSEASKNSEKCVPDPTLFNKTNQCGKDNKKILDIKSPKAIKSTGKSDNIPILNEKLSISSCSTNKQIDDELVNGSQQHVENSYKKSSKKSKSLKSKLLKFDPRTQKYLKENQSKIHITEHCDLKSVSLDSTCPLDDKKTENVEIGFGRSLRSSRTKQSRNSTSAQSNIIEDVSLKSPKMSSMEVDNTGKNSSKKITSELVCNQKSSKKSSPEFEEIDRKANKKSSKSSDRKLKLSLDIATSNESGMTSRSSRSKENKIENQKHLKTGTIPDGNHFEKNASKPPSSRAIKTNSEKIRVNHFSNKDSSRNFQPKVILEDINKLSPESLNKLEDSLKIDKLLKIHNSDRIIRDSSRPSKSIDNQTNYEVSEISKDEKKKIRSSRSLKSKHTLEMENNYTSKSDKKTDENKLNKNGGQSKTSRSVVQEKDAAVVPSSSKSKDGSEKKSKSKSVRENVESTNVKDVDKEKNVVKEIIDTKFKQKKQKSSAKNKHIEVETLTSNKKDLELIKLNEENIQKPLIEDSNKSACVDSKIDNIPLDKQDLPINKEKVFPKKDAVKKLGCKKEDTKINEVELYKTVDDQTCVEDTRKKDEQFVEEVPLSNKTEAEDSQLTRKQKDIKNLVIEPLENIKLENSIKNQRNKIGQLKSNPIVNPKEYKSKIMEEIQLRKRKRDEDNLDMKFKKSAKLAGKVELLGPQEIEKLQSTSENISISQAVEDIVSNNSANFVEGATINVLKTASVKSVVGSSLKENVAANDIEIVSANSENLEDREQEKSITNISEISMKSVESPIKENVIANDLVSMSTNSKDERVMEGYEMPSREKQSKDKSKSTIDNVPSDNISISSVIMKEVLQNVIPTISPNPSKGTSGVENISVDKLKESSHCADNIPPAQTNHNVDIVVMQELNQINLDHADLTMKLNSNENNNVKQISEEHEMNTVKEQHQVDNNKSKLKQKNKADKRDNVKKSSKAIEVLSNDKILKLGKEEQNVEKFDCKPVEDIIKEDNTHKAAQEEVMKIATKDFTKEPEECIEPKHPNVIVETIPQFYDEAYGLNRLDSSHVIIRLVTPPEKIIEPGQLDDFLEEQVLIDDDLSTSGSLNVTKSDTPPLDYDETPLSEKVKKNGSLSTKALPGTETAISDVCLSEQVYVGLKPIVSEPSDNSPGDSDADYPFPEQDNTLGFLTEDDLIQDECMIDPNTNESMFIPNTCKEEIIEHEEKVVNYYTNEPQSNPQLSDDFINDNDNQIREEFSGPMSVEAMNQWMDNSLQAAESSQCQQIFNPGSPKDSEITSDGFIKKEKHSFICTNIGFGDMDGLNSNKDVVQETWSQKKIMEKKEPFIPDTMKGIFLNKGDLTQVHKKVHNSSLQTLSINSAATNTHIPGLNKTETTAVEMQKLSTNKKTATSKKTVKKNESKPAEKIIGKVNLVNVQKLKPEYRDECNINVHTSNLSKVCTGNRKQVIRQSPIKDIQNMILDKVSVQPKANLSYLDVPKSKRKPETNDTTLKQNGKKRQLSHTETSQERSRKRLKSNIIDPEEVSSNFEQEIRKKPIDNRSFAVTEPDTHYTRSPSVSRRHTPDTSRSGKSSQHAMDFDKYKYHNEPTHSRGHTNNSGSSRRNTQSESRYRRYEQDHVMNTRSHYNNSRFLNHIDSSMPTDNRHRYYSDNPNNRVNSFNYYSTNNHHLYTSSNTGKPHDRNRRDSYLDAHHSSRRSEVSFPLANFRILNPRMQYQQQSWEGNNKM